MYLLGRGDSGQVTGPISLTSGRVPQILLNDVSQKDKKMVLLSHFQLLIIFFSSKNTCDIGISSSRDNMMNGINRECDWNGEK